MIRRCERERWTQFLRSFWEGWNIVQRLVCHPIAHPQFPPTGVYKPFKQERENWIDEIPTISREIA